MSRTDAERQKFWSALRQGKKAKPPAHTLNGRLKIQKRISVYPWLTKGATSPAGLAKHRESLERDCFPHEGHRKLMREAAVEYDAWRAIATKGGRPRSVGISVPSRKQRKAAA